MSILLDCGSDVDLRSTITRTPASLVRNVAVYLARLEAPIALAAATNSFSRF